MLDMAIQYIDWDTSYIRNRSTNSWAVSGSLTALMQETSRS